MTRTGTVIRCVPRYGYDFAEVRSVEIDVPRDASEADVHSALERWFAAIGIADAVFAVETDDHGLFAIINDEAYHTRWGKSLGL